MRISYETFKEKFSYALIISFDYRVSDILESEILQAVDTSAEEFQSASRVVLKNKRTEETIFDVDSFDVSSKGYYLYEHIIDNNVFDEYELLSYIQNKAGIQAPVAVYRVKNPLSLAAFLSMAREALKPLE